MRDSKRLVRECWVALAWILVVASGRADEGMWLLNAPPLQKLKENYHFEPTPQWLEHVQKASVRFNSGGSGSFVSPDGLIITNHHVAADDLQKVSTPEHNYLKDGFYARSRGDEIKCTNLELNVLISIEDVTERVNALVGRMSAADAAAARRSAFAAIEKESLESTGLRSDVVTLYQGGQYHLYRYKRYTDVRIVFAPEQQAAFYGGDPDNFEFPRYDLDITFMRAYENGQPAKVENYFKFQPKGVAENELVFVCGSPGRTDRLLTLAELSAMRDWRVPTVLTFIKFEEVALNAWGARTEENARRARDDYFSMQNSRKVYDGHIQALFDPALFEAKKKQEEDLKTFAKDHAELAEYLQAWDEVARAQRALSENADRQLFLESRDPTRTPIPTYNSVMVRLARELFRSSTERLKPNGERLREYRDSNRASLEQELFSEEPIFNDLETLNLSQFLTFMAMKLGAENSITKLVLSGRPPAARASDLILGTKIKDVAFRQQLYAMSPAEMAKVDDPLIAFVRSIDTEARAARKVYDEETNARERAHAGIEKIRYAKFGASVYPDATFTLRLSYGVVKGYEEEGKRVDPITRIAGLYERSAEHKNREPFDLPATWIKQKSQLDQSTPLNFVHTCDIIGGNSGSPTINRAGEFVGIIFDGNIHSLVADYNYDDVQSRAVSVDVRGILEALRKVYGTKTLLVELIGHE